MNRSLRLAAALFTAAILGGCATGVKIDKSYTSENQDSRSLFLVLHYTVGNFESSLKQLTKPSSRPVSSHYLVSAEPVRTYQLVDENRRAWHAGPSYWKGHSNLNAASIGIEIVHPGRVKNADGTESYVPYVEAQMDEVLALSIEIVKRHGIKPDRIVGHSDIQPRTKQDPGPFFPGKRFHEAGLIPWPDEGMVMAKKIEFEQALPDVKWFQSRLAEHGFAAASSGEFDAYTRDCLAAFQMKYRPSNFDGQMDAETAALLFTVTSPEGMKMKTPPSDAKPYTSRW